MRFNEFKLLNEAPNTKTLGPVGAKPLTQPTKDKEKDGILKVGPPYPPDVKDAVSAMQADLKKLGYDIGQTGVDGKYGPRTKAAVDAFKKDYKISGDGSNFSPEDTQILNKVTSGIIAKVPPSLVATPKGQAGSFGIPVPVPGSNDAKAIKKVIDAGAGFTDVETVSGEQLRRKGTRNWRNNNPGNLEFGPFARSRGAVGTDGRFAVFPTLEAGMKAKEDLVFGKNYIDLNIYNAIAKYAPETENDVRMYVNQIVQATGASPETKLRDLSSEQRKSMLNTITRVEGFRTGQVIALGKSSNTTA
jgi:peptidoglycan hydrolase-like protein with peptidoglycan-binding domain